MWSRISLRVRVTVLSGLIIVITCVALTYILVLNAGKSFSAPLGLVSTIVAENNGTTPAMPAKQLGDLPPIEAVQALFEAARQTFMLHSMLYAAMIVLMGVVSIWFITGRALKPVTELSRVIENIDEQNLSEHVSVPKSRDEVSRLAHSFNGMLTKVSAAYEGQKRFAQNAAHELKTPIAAILTNIEVMELEEEPSIEDYKEAIAVSKENAERMSTLIQDLLMMNTVSNKALYTKFHFDDIVSSIKKNLSHDIQNKNIDFTCKGDIVINGNKALLERAFENIIQNAVRYNKNNGEISIICTNDKILISDTGIGIPPDKLDKIFEPFYCADVSRSRKLGGSGLGLAIAKQVFDSHNMGIKAESEENKGMTFTIDLKS